MGGAADRAGWRRSRLLRHCTGSSVSSTASDCLRQKLAMIKTRIYYRTLQDSSDHPAFARHRRQFPDKIFAWIPGNELPSILCRGTAHFLQPGPAFPCAVHRFVQ
jgi:hypothetical protein